MVDDLSLIMFEPVKLYCLEYMRIHSWAKRKHPKPIDGRCECCGEFKARLEHSNKNHIYRKITEDWQWLCHGCHTQYDMVFNNKSEKMSVWQRDGKNPMNGQHHTNEAKQKISQHNKGLKRTEEMNKKQSDRMKIFMTNNNHPLLGKHHSEETKRKLCVAQKGKHLSQETKDKISAAGKKYFSDPLNRQKHGEISKKMWADPEFRKNQSEGAKGNKNGNYRHDISIEDILKLKEKEFNKNKISKTLGCSWFMVMDRLLSASLT